MPRISYEYHKFEFPRSPLVPMRKDEFVQVIKDFELFLGNYIDEQEAEYKKLKNPHRFNLKLFLVLLLICLGCGFTGDFLEKQKHENFGLALDLIAIGVGFAIIMQPVQWIMSAMKSSSFSAFEKKAREYFSFHRSIANASANNYETYLRLVSENSISDFVVFCHEEM